MGVTCGDVGVGVPGVRRWDLSAWVFSAREFLARYLAEKTRFHTGTWPGTRKRVFRPKASLHKGFPQRGRAATRPAPFVGGGRRPPPLWRLAFGGYVGYRAMSRQKDSLLKDCLLKCRSHFKEQSFKRGSCVGWNIYIYVLCVMDKNMFLKVLRLFKSALG